MLGRWPSRGQKPALLTLSSCGLRSFPSVLPQGQGTPRSVAQRLQMAAWWPAQCLAHRKLSSRSLPWHVEGLRDSPTQEGPWRPVASRQPGQGGGEVERPRAQPQPALVSLCASAEG